MAPETTDPVSVCTVEADDCLLAPLDDVSDCEWSARIALVDTGQVLADRSPTATLSTASIGKLLLLSTVAEQLSDGTLNAEERLARAKGVQVKDSGLWQFLEEKTLAVSDLALLVGAVSDNQATNALVERVGLGAVEDTAARIGLSSMRLLDIVRDVRGSGHPPRLSEANAADLVTYVGELVTHPGPVRDRVLGWLQAGVDLSMVPGDLGFDPLAHAGPDRGITVLNKTGTDFGVRADVGVMAGPRRRFSYAVIANWSPARDDDPVRDAVLKAMRKTGSLMARACRAS